MGKFAKGQRVLYTSQHIDWVPYGSHRASMGNNGYMLLDVLGEDGKIQPISGTILGELPLPDGSIVYGFAPDGWLSPAKGWKPGFQVDERDLSEMPEPEIYSPGKVVK